MVAYNWITTKGRLMRIYALIIASHLLYTITENVALISPIAQAQSSITAIMQQTEKTQTMTICRQYIIAVWLVNKNIVGLCCSRLNAWHSDLQPINNIDNIDMHIIFQNVDLRLFLFTYI
jgi:hypothetical protein